MGVVSGPMKLFGRPVISGIVTLLCLVGRARTQVATNEEYTGCPDDDYACFLTTGHGAMSDGDYAEAAVQFKKGADAGYGPGLDALGFLHQMGQGVERNTDLAFDYYTKAARAEDLQGMFHVGACYSKGIGVKADQSKAIEWWQKAVETGRHASSAYNVGLRYEAGYGVMKDAKKAFEYLLIAAEENHLGGMYNIGVFTSYTSGPRQNKTEGCQWFINVTMGERSQHKNDPVIGRAMTNLALCYLTGRGMKHDVAEGWRWLELAVTKNGDGAERARTLISRGKDEFKVYKKPSYKDDLDL